MALKYVQVNSSVQKKSSSTVMIVIATIAFIGVAIFRMRPASLLHASGCFSYTHLLIVENAQDVRPDLAELLQRANVCDPESRIRYGDIVMMEHLSLEDQQRLEAEREAYVQMRSLPLSYRGIAISQIKRLRAVGGSRGFLIRTAVKEGFDEGLRSQAIGEFHSLLSIIFYKEGAIVLTKEEQTALGKLIQEHKDYSFYAVEIALQAHATELENVFIRLPRQYRCDVLNKALDADLSTDSFDLITRSVYDKDRAVRRIAINTIRAKKYNTDYLSKEQQATLDRVKLRIRTEQ